MKTAKPMFGELYDKAMGITDEQEAYVYFKLLVKQVEGKPEEEAEALVRHNLGYWAGYYDQKTRIRVEKLYGAVHPIFGSVESSKNLTVEEILNMGVKIAKGEMKLPEPVIKRRGRKVQW
jgi:ribosomal protein L9